MAMLPLSMHLTVYTGASFRRELRWRPDGGGGQDFTGWTARMRIGYGPRSLLTLTVGAGITLSATGQITITLTAAQVAGLPPGIYAHQLDLSDPTGAVTRFQQGRLNVIAGMAP